MVDILTPTQRSYNMSMIKSVGTGPEIQVREMLISSRIGSFQMNAKDILGKPDFYFPKEKTAIFLDGCYWHGCKECFKLPNTNKQFWSLKIKNNIARDNKVNKELRKAGFNILRIKEHELKQSPEKVFKKIKMKLSKNNLLRVLDLFAGAGGFSEGFTTCAFVM
jgi:DNA mismatch endonuclease (patch repair protein)